MNAFLGSHNILIVCMLLIVKRQTFSLGSMSSNCLPLFNRNHLTVGNQVIQIKVQVEGQ